MTLLYCPEHWSISLLKDLKKIHSVSYIAVRRLCVDSLRASLLPKICFQFISESVNEQATPTQQLRLGCGGDITHTNDMPCKPIKLPALHSFNIPFRRCFLLVVVQLRQNNAKWI